MKAVLEILSGKIDAGDCVLICEAGTDGFSYVIKNEASNEFVALAVYHFSGNYAGENSSPVLKEIFKNEGMLSESFKKVFVIYSYPESVLVPFEMYNSQKNSSVLNMIHGDFTENDAVRSDVIEEIKAYNVYRIPSKLKDDIESQFPSAECLHQYSALAKNASPDGNKITVIFYPNKIVLTVMKEGKLMLVNSFLYKRAEDVSYILLNTCQQFEMENVTLEASGLIEQNSALYKEIYKYFEHVSFAPLPGEIIMQEDFAVYPSHFFSHFFTIL